jgi:tRNA(Ile)-lysidine synthase
VALHVNYGLRKDADEDETAARDLCARLGVELVVERPDRGPGNLHAWARDVRYEAAERLRSERSLDWIAVAHTRSDLAETVIYRLATSPGTRALVAMPEARGAVIRPLLGLSRSQVRAAAVDAGLPFVDDRSNDDPAFARARIRGTVLPVFEGLNPAVLDTIAATRAELGEELDFISGAAAQVIGESKTVSEGELRTCHPAVRRHVVRLLVERATGRSSRVSTEQVEEALRLLDRSEGGAVDLGHGAFLVAEGGTLVAERRPAEPTPGELAMDLPAGAATWGGWSVEARPMASPFRPEGPEVATVDADLLGARIAVRGWREGDRIRPLGMDGSKTLQDLFTDKGLRRSERRTHPVFVSASGDVVWVPGLAVAEPFRITAGTTAAVRLEARRISPAVSP